MSALKERLQNDIKDAMRARDKDRLSILRLIAAGIKQKEVDERITLDDSQIVAIIDKMIKQQRDALTQFESAGRTDLVDKSNFELGILQIYMPALLSAAELNTIISESIVASGAKSPADMGKVMSLLKPKVQGRCDMGNLSKQIKEKLSQLG
jgi:uncharacterized protein YqeY